MRFEDIVMDYDDSLEGVQGIVEYGPYELSIIKHKYSYGGTKGLYEIAVFKNAEQVELPGITAKGDTVKGFLTENEVDGIMVKMFTITGKEPEQV
jgi:hypothetical protein